ncbi:MAG: putative TPR repeat methyltransferase [Planctomycetota bacterium]
MAELNTAKTIGRNCMKKPKTSLKHGVERYHHIDQNRDSSGQLKTIYADWADSYDVDNNEKLGTVSQPNAVALLAKFLQDRQAPIIDIGCGTGLVGQHLQATGFHCFDGTDLSPEMLEHAHHRGYRHLFTCDADQGIPVADAAYQATICVGVFTHSHLGPSLFAELLRITRVGGIIVFTVNEGVYDSGEFSSAIEQYIDCGAWKLLESAKQAYMVDEGVDAWYFALKKTQP